MIYCQESANQDPVNKFRVSVDKPAAFCYAFIGRDHPVGGHILSTTVDIVVNKLLVRYNQLFPK